MLLLPFLFGWPIRFGLSQIWLTLIKYIEKYSDNYTIQHLHYQLYFMIDSMNKFGIVNIIIFL